MKNRETRRASVTCTSRDTKFNHYIISLLEWVTAY